MELPQRVDIRPVAFLTALAKPDLRFTEIALQIVVDDIEVLEGRKLGIRNKWELDEELALLRVDIETVAGVDADLLADASDQSVHLLVEVCRVVDHVEVRVTDPCCGCVVVELPGQLYPLGSTGVILVTKQTIIIDENFINSLDLRQVQKISTETKTI